MCRGDRASIFYMGHISYGTNIKPLRQNRSVIQRSADCIADVNVVKQLNTMETQMMNRCPACRMPFDLGKRRRLVDTCGHERCHSCMFNSDLCPVCSDSDRKFCKYFMRVKNKHWNQGFLSCCTDSLEFTPCLL